MALVANSVGKVGFGIALGCLAVGTIAQITSSGSAVGKGVGAACGVLLVIAEVRIATAGVVQKDGMVIVRNWTRTWTIPRLQIEEVAVVPSGNAAGGTTCVGFRLTDGRLIRALPTASYSAQKVLGFQARLMFL